MDQFSRTIVRSLSEYKQLIDDKKRFGLYKELHELQFEVLNYLSEKKVWHQLELISLQLTKEFPQNFTYFFFYFLSLSELNKIQLLNESVFDLLDEIFFEGKTFEDFRGSNSELAMLLTEIKADLDSSHDNYLWEALTSLLKNINLKEQPQKKEWKYLTSMLLMKQTPEVLKFALYVLGAWKKNDLVYEIYQYGIKNKFIDFVQLTKNNFWIKEIIITKDKTDLLKIEASSVNNKNETQEYTRRLMPRKFQEQNEFIDESPIIISLRYSPPSMETIPDLIVAYQMMGFDLVVLELFKLAKTNKMNSDIEKKIRYMELSHYLFKKQYHLALSLSQELRLSDLDEEQLLEVNYIEGSIYQKLGLKKEARESFKRVWRVNKEYRQIQERMKELEKN